VALAGSLPKVATVVGALIPTYWIYVSSGVIHQETHTISRSNGSYEQIETIDRAPFALKIKALGGVFDIAVGARPAPAPERRDAIDDGQPGAGSGKTSKPPATRSKRHAAPKGKMGSSNKTKDHESRILPACDGPWLAWKGPEAVRCQPIDRCEGLRWPNASWALRQNPPVIQIGERSF
jgi:hypothetical protein